METNVLDERQKFVRDFESGHWSMTELCERYGVTRPTGYKWVARHRAGGRAALADRSRAPHHCPHRTRDASGGADRGGAAEYGWGAKKLLAVLRTRYPTRAGRRAVPSTRCWSATACSASTGAAARGRTRARAPVQTDASESGVAGRLQRAVQDGGWPVLLSPDRDRSFQSARCWSVTRCRRSRRRRRQPVFRALFRTVGLPDAIRTDNGSPFASPAIHGLSALNVWWMQLGIVHQRIAPASPQENGRHERMHRELKRETTRPAARTARAQQRRFDAFGSGITTSGLTKALAIARPRRSGHRRRGPIPSASAAGVSRAHGGPPHQHAQAPSRCTRRPSFVTRDPARRGHWPRRGRRRDLEYRLLPNACSAGSISAPAT